MNDNASGVVQCHINSNEQPESAATAYLSLPIAVVSYSQRAIKVICHFWDPKCCCRLQICSLTTGTISCAFGALLGRCRDASRPGTLLERPDLQDFSTFGAHLAAASPQIISSG